MQALTIHSNVGDDLILTLTLPEMFRNRAVKVILEPEETIQNTPEPRDANGWPVGFFERTEGKWQGKLERGPQGEFETRESF